MTNSNEPISIDIPEKPDEAPKQDDAQQENEQQLNASPATTPRSPTSPFRSKAAQQMALSWHDLVFEVETQEGMCGRGSTTKQIVKNTSGEFKPGTLTALMGPSGAGKSTMMNVLAGRATYGTITEGKVVLNNKEANPVDYRRHLAYVMQQDSMFATQTPREVLHFTARLRLPEYTDEERAEIVEAAITALRLEKCADTLIGSVLVPGLSGGEKKRTAVAVELISSPSLIFLDEPTSGLDSHSAYELVLILKQLAADGCTIVCTIHQPSSEVFALFDAAVFLRQGSVVYRGPVDEVIAHFETSGVTCKPNTNPSDFAMQRLQLMDDAEMEALIEKLPAVASPEVTGVLHENELPKIKSAGAGVQMLQLLRREFFNMIRDRATLGARFGMSVALALIIGVVYYDVGSSWGEDNDLSDRSIALNDHWGALVFVVINAMFLAAQSLVLAFPQERAAFVREYTAGTYGVVSYVVAKSMLDIPAAIVQQLLSFVIFYFLAGMNGNFILLTLSAGALAVVSASIALMIGAATPTAETAVNLLPAIFVPQILFSGFFVSTSQIPSWLRWLQWVCPVKYGVNLVTIVEFADDAIPDNRRGDVDFLIERSEINRDHWWIYVLIMVGMLVVLRVLATILLKVRARSFG